MKHFDQIRKPKLKQSKFSISDFNFSALIIVLLTMLLFPATRLQAQTVEDGTAEHPFLIESKQELMDFADCMNSNRTFYHNGHTFVRSCEGDSCVTIYVGGTMEGDDVAHFKLTTDIVMNEGNVSGCDGVMQPGWTEWVPIGNINGVLMVVTT